MGFISWLYKTQKATHISSSFLLLLLLLPLLLKSLQDTLVWSFTISQNPNVPIWYIEDFQVCQQKVVPACMVAQKITNLWFCEDIYDHPCGTRYIHQKKKIQPEHSKHVYSRGSQKPIHIKISLKIVTIIY